MWARFIGLLALESLSCHYYSLSLGLHMRRLIWWKWRARHTMFSCFFFISFSFDLRWYSCYLFLFLSHSFSSFSSRRWFCFLPLLVFSFYFANLLYYFYFLFIYSYYLFNFSSQLCRCFFLYFIVHDKVINLAFC